MDIKTDDDLLGVLDDLRHGLKAGQPYSYMRADFANVVADFLKRWRLDEAQHSFAEWPKDPNAAANVCRDKSARRPDNLDIIPEEPPSVNEAERLAAEVINSAGGLRPGMEPVGESPTEKAPGFGLFRPEEIPALLMGTWLAAGGFASFTVRRICGDAGIDPDRTQAIVDAYVTKGGPNVY